MNVEPGPDWVTLYYDSLRHLLNNPDWIEALPSEVRRSIDPELLKKKRRNVEVRIERLRRLESSLHHTINVFFSLAPPSFIAKLLDIKLDDDSGLRIVDCAPDRHEWKIDMDGKVRNLMDLTQPDLFVEGPGFDVAVELKKAGGKSSLEQVLKYLAILLLRRRGLAALPQQRLVFIGPHEGFGAFWGGAYPNEKALKEALRGCGDDRLRGRFEKFGTSMEAVEAMADRVDIRFLPLRDWLPAIDDERRQLASGQHPAVEVYCRLLAGFQNELHRWPDGG